MLRLTRSAVFAVVMLLTAIPAGSSQGEAVSSRDSVTLDLAQGASPNSSQGQGRGRGRDHDSRGKPITPVRIQRLGVLHFGRFGSNGPAGAITINPHNGVKTVSGGVFDFGGIHSRARFRIRGERNKYVIVTLPNQIPVSAVGGGSLSMTIKNFTMNATNPIFLGPNGRVDIYVGATLGVKPSQHQGIYFGLFTVEAEYP